MTTRNERTAKRLQEIRECWQANMSQPERNHAQLAFVAECHMDWLIQEVERSAGPRSEEAEAPSELPEVECLQLIAAEMREQFVGVTDAGEAQVAQAMIATVERIAAELPALRSSTGNAGLLERKLDIANAAWRAEAHHVLELQSKLAAAESRATLMEKERLAPIVADRLDALAEEIDGGEYTAHWRQDRDFLREIASKIRAARSSPPDGAET